MRALYEWVLGHARGVAGLALFVPGIWRWLLNALGWFGDADLVISKYNDPGWLGVMVHALLNPPAWLNLPLIVLGLSFIWWDVIRHRRAFKKAAVVSEPAQSAQPMAPTQQVPALKIVPMPNGMFAAAAPTAHPPTGLRSPPLPQPDWGTLFRVTDNGEVELRFLPDTPDLESDTLLLVILGYQVMLDAQSVRSSVAALEVLRAMRDSPNADTKRKFFLALDFNRNINGHDIGAKAIDRGEIERTGLARGGHYQLTGEGQIRARKIAVDLIRRA